MVDYTLLFEAMRLTMHVSRSAKDAGRRYSCGLGQNHAVIMPAVQMLLLNGDSESQPLEPRVLWSVPDGLHRLLDKLCVCG